MDVNTLKGFAVISLTEGTKLGYVEQPLLDLNALQLAALRVKGDAGAFVVPFSQLQNIGTDAVMVTSSDVTQTAASGGVSSGLTDPDTMKKLKVVDKSGTFIGTISGIDIDVASGKIVELRAHKGGMLGMGGATTPIDPATILSVGPELMTLNTEVATS